MHLLSSTHASLGPFQFRPLLARMVRQSEAGTDSLGSPSALSTLPSDVLATISDCEGSALLSHVCKGTWSVLHGRNARFRILQDEVSEALAFLGVPLSITTLPRDRRRFGTSH